MLCKTGRHSALIHIMIKLYTMPHLLFLTYCPLSGLRFVTCVAVEKAAISLAKSDFFVLQSIYNLF